MAQADGASTTTQHKTAASNNQNMDKPAFRVIIVGGGPAGLGMAHALTLAGIDYILLERGAVINASDGASIALWPHSVRIMDQFGLLEEARTLHMPIREKYNLLPDGQVRDSNRMFEQIEIKYGHPWMLFHRIKLLDLLYQKLPEKDSKILTNKNVVDIEAHEDGVRVICEDKSSFEGSIVVGCDGVHSRVRRIVREQELRSGQRASDVERPMTASYHGLTGWLPLLPGMKAGTVWECRGKRMSFHVLNGMDDAYFFAYCHLDQPRSGRQDKYTDNDAEALAQSVADHPVTDKLSFGDIWKAKKWAKMIDYEEGFLNKWYGDRIVLVGDAVHKSTPNAGLSLNTGWQAMVELTNRLHSLLIKDPNPNRQTLKKVFEAYQGSRKGIAKQTMSFSSLYTRVVAWENSAYQFADWLAPKIGGDLLLLSLLASPIVKKGLTLDFVAEKGFKEGRVRWLNRPKEDQDEAVGDSRL